MIPPEAQNAPTGLETAPVKEDYIPEPGVVEESVVFNPWKDGSFRAVVYARPLNPRLLLVNFGHKSHGRLVIAHSERGKFSVGQEVWVKNAGGKDLYLLAGVYNRFGKRFR